MRFARHSGIINQDKEVSELMYDRYLLLKDTADLIILMDSRYFTSCPAVFERSAAFLRESILVSAGRAGWGAQRDYGLPLNFESHTYRSQPQK